MISRIQNNTAFKGVYLKRNSETIKNIKKAQETLINNAEETYSYILNFTENNFNGTLAYGMKQLNDKEVDDGETRFLTAEAIYDEKGSPSGYILGIEDEDGNEFSSASSFIPGASVLALKNAFDDLKQDYKKNLAIYAMQRYKETSSSIDSVLAPYIIDENYDNK